MHKSATQQKFHSSTEAGYIIILLLTASMNHSLFRSSCFLILLFEIFKYLGDYQTKHHQ